MERFSDADTLWVTTDTGSQKVRLAYADAPETKHGAHAGQPLGADARTFAYKWVGKTVRVYPKGRSFDRVVAEVQTLDHQSIGLDLVSVGYAENDPRFPVPADYKAAQQDAMEKRLGVWAQENHIPPWEWRKMQKGVK